MSKKISAIRPGNLSGGPRWPTGKWASIHVTAISDETLSDNADICKNFSDAVSRVFVGLLDTPGSDRSAWKFAEGLAAALTALANHRHFHGKVRIGSSASDHAVLITAYQPTVISVVGIGP
ncbi:hypothetical protein [Paraburkholderia haematera]|uniref:hypothetical protein n=1 Tax=Paraburkholderia haematera TaxID=2793077 RepID=UPI001B8B23B1|nr:hypothetical protein [Paraburkholderia haematera]